MAICSCSSWSERPSKWRKGWGEVEEEAEKEERRETPKEGNPVFGFWRGQQRDWAIAVAFLKRQTLFLRMKQKPHCVFPLHELIRFPKEITGDGLLQFTRLLLHHANLVGSKISSIFNIEGSLLATLNAVTDLVKQVYLGKG